MGYRSSAASGWSPEAIPVEVPGDKSISHRALMLAALAEGESRIDHLATGADVRSTAGCLRSLGAKIEHKNGSVTVTGGGLSRPSSALDAGNSGTTMRLMSGLLAGHAFESAITGDESLRRRPMGRIADPLSRMGATISTDDGHAPIRISGGNLTAIDFESPVPSAQVKSCVLLAGLFAAGRTSVTESVKSRDHTERMLAATGIDIRVEGTTVTVSGGRAPDALTLRVPGDLSSAAFFFALGALAGEVTVRGVGVNPTRTAFLDVLKRMGAMVSITPGTVQAGEPVGDVTVRRGDLHGIDVGADEVPQLLDELPLLALLGALADGTTSVTDAAELRVKESDRISTVVSELGKLGANITELSDGFTVRGRPHLTGAACLSHGDHRIAMMLAIAAGLARGETIIDGAECVDISYPAFAPTLRSLGVSVAQA